MDDNDEMVTIPANVLFGASTDQDTENNFQPNNYVNAFSNLRNP